VKDELAKLEPKIGETVGVAYHGRSEPRGAGDSGYERYRVKVAGDRS
jgi:hypothetical protein